MDAGPAEGGPQWAATSNPTPHRLWLPLPLGRLPSHSPTRTLPSLPIWLSPQGSRALHVVRPDTYVRSRRSEWALTGPRNKGTNGGRPMALAEALISLLQTGREHYFHLKTNTNTLWNTTQNL